MLLTMALTVQLLDVAELDRIRFDPEIFTPNVNADVSPKSVVVVSVNLAVVPLHKLIIWPARAFEPE